MRREAQFAVEAVVVGRQFDLGLLRQFAEFRLGFEHLFGGSLVFLGELGLDLGNRRFSRP